MDNKKESKRLLFMTRGRSTRGGHIVFVNIVRKLRNEGYDVTFVTSESREQMKKNVPYWDNLDVNYLEIPHVQERDSEQIEHIKASSIYLKENLEKFDRIILDSWFISLAAIRENIFSEKIFHLVQSDPFFAPENQSEFWKAQLFGLLPLTPMNRIMVSKVLASNFVERYKKDFMYLDLFLDDLYLKTKFEIKEREIIKIVSSSSTFGIKTKGLDFLLDQLEKIKDFKFELTLISGDDIRKDLSIYSFPITVKNAKNPQEMVDELRQHDIYVNTSTEESFCLALAEAIAMGMPAVALDSVGNREYMNGENAIFIENTEYFIAGILKMRDLDFRKKISQKAKSSMQKYTIDNTVTQLKNIVNI